MMVEELDCLWSLLSLLLSLFYALKKHLSMMIVAPPSWKRLADMPVSTKKDGDSAKKAKVFDGEELRGDACSSGKGRRMRRPSKIAIPRSDGVGLEVGEAFRGMDADLGRATEVEGSGYWLASRRGMRHRMEDEYLVITNIHEDAKQALFGVLDGHGGRAAVDFVSEKLGKNIVNAVDDLKGSKEEEQLESAIKSAYLTTDQEFLSQGLSGGTCVATVLLKNGNLHVSNAGDCRVVMSRQGVADVLTNDHRPGREDERTRIENSGGYVSCYNGVWRVQDTLAVSRAIGDVSIKKWIISEPETRIIQLTKDCEFLIMASDGLWDKVSNQEAVDLVRRCKNSIQSCKDLVEISCSRGNRDDATVMVVDLQRFCVGGGG